MNKTNRETTVSLMDLAEALVKERIQGTRKGLPNEPNYLHSFRVRDMVSQCHHWDDPDQNLFIAALLHDVVEDGGVSFEDLKNMGFTHRTIELVRLCTHSMDIKDSTQRWVRMIARLVEADDEDAWRIKLADLADNLTQSKGLSPEKRRFMVEVKAPLLLRLAPVSYTPHYLLNMEMDKQRIELTKQWRYVVTRWTDEFDSEGMSNDFAVLGTFEDRSEAYVSAMTEMESFIRNRLDVKKDWAPVVRDDAERAPFFKPNKFNKIVLSRSASRGDGTGYNSLYGFIEVVEVPYDAVIDERLFNAREIGWDISRFFEGLDEGKDKAALFKLKQKRHKPTQCQLWKKDVLTDGDLDNAFDVAHTFSEDPHFSRRVVKCKECGQLYLKEFYEVVDWINGENPQYVTYVPVENQEDAESINRVGVWEIQTFSPRINRELPKGKPRRLCWVGR